MGGDSSARVHTCRLSLNMAPLVKISLLLLLAEAALGARRLRNNRHLQDSRGSRSLTNTFPFNAQERNEDHHHGEDHEHHEPHEHHEAHPEVAKSEAVSVSDLASRV